VRPTAPEEVAQAPEAAEASEVDGDAAAEPAQAAYNASASILALATGDTLPIRERISQFQVKSPAPLFPICGDPISPIRQKSNSFLQAAAEAAVKAPERSPSAVTTTGRYFRAPSPTMATSDLSTPPAETSFEKTPSAVTRPAEMPSKQTPPAVTPRCTQPTPPTAAAAEAAPTPLYSAAFRALLEATEEDQCEEAAAAAAAAAASAASPSSPCSHTSSRRVSFVSDEGEAAPEGGLGSSAVGSSAVGSSSKPAIPTRPISVARLLADAIARCVPERLCQSDSARATARSSCDARPRSSAPSPRAAAPPERTELLSASLAGERLLLRRWNTVQWRFSEAQRSALSTAAYYYKLRPKNRGRSTSADEADVLAQLWVLAVRATCDAPFRAWALLARRSRRGESDARVVQLTEQEQVLAHANELRRRHRLELSARNEIAERWLVGLVMRMRLGVPFRRWRRATPRRAVGCIRFYIAPMASRVVLARALRHLRRHVALDRRYGHSALDRRRVRWATLGALSRWRMHNARHKLRLDAARHGVHGSMRAALFAWASRSFKQASADMRENTSLRATAAARKRFAVNALWHQTAQEAYRSLSESRGDAKRMTAALAALGGHWTGGMVALQLRCEQLERSKRAVLERREERRAFSERAKEAEAEAQQAIASFEEEQRTLIPSLQEEARREVELVCLNGARLDGEYAHANDGMHGWSHILRVCAAAEEEWLGRLREADTRCKDQMRRLGNLQVSVATTRQMLSRRSPMASAPPLKAPSPPLKAPSPESKASSPSLTLSG